MSVTKDENKKILDPADGEDLPSDFFDDFSKEEFIEGLSVIDSWDDSELNKKRECEVPLDSGIKMEQQSDKEPNDQNQEEKLCKGEDNPTESRQESVKHQSPSNSKLDDYIKPGSRRDPSKTKEAIRRDKEVKVKEYLAKHLDSTDDIRPPGTELDDYFYSDKSVKTSNPPVIEQTKKTPWRSRSKDRQRRKSPKQRRTSPKNRRYSPKEWSYKNDTHWKNQRRELYSGHRYSPRYIPKRVWRPSPTRSSRRRSPQHFSSRHYSPKRSKYSTSPDHSRNFKSRRSQSPANRDSFLYPEVTQAPTYAPTPTYDVGPAPSFTGASNDFSIPGPSYNQGQVYTGSYSGYEGYSGQPVQQLMPAIPALMSFDAVVAPVICPPNSMVPPSMVPAPAVSANMEPQNQLVNKKYDALAQLVADGKLSQADYLKLAPNKGGTLLMDDKTRVMVLSRCDEAISKLQKLLLPNRLLINNNMLVPEPKSIMPSYCSPLKRQPAVEFHFTKAPSSLTQRQNKQLLDSIISSIGLEKSFSRSKKKTKDTQDVGVQTTKPYCDVCDIRESVKFNDATTSIDRAEISSTVHTQVLEEDLMNSKSVFNPSGSVGVNGPISIAHLTPAQLVSQLAARAKSLKQPDNPQPVNQFTRRNQPYDGRGDQQYYHDYRYYN